MDAPPLSLELHRRMPRRAPVPGQGTLRFGYDLTLPGGFVVTDSDPLLRAYGARVITIEPDQVDGIQGETFDPGRSLRLIVEGVDDDGDAVVGIWDDEAVRRAGTLHFQFAVVVAAGLEHGLPMAGFVLQEERSARDDTRTKLGVVIHSPSFVRILDTVASAYTRPLRAARRRIVLFADGIGEPRWWDPSAAGGPAELTDLPVSAELGEELRALKEAYATLSKSEKPDDYFEALEHGWTREALQTRTRAVWARARAELGRNYAVGLLGPGMERPVWSPHEVSDEPDDDDIPF